MDVSVLSIDPSLDKIVDIEVQGWEKLKVLYSVELYNGVSFLCWKVEGTEHIFRILTSTVYQNHGLNFSEHFSLTLEKFREDYLEWEEQGMTEEWMQRYKRMFQHLIII